MASSFQSRFPRTVAATSQVLAGCYCCHSVIHFSSVVFAFLQLHLVLPHVLSTLWRTSLWSKSSQLCKFTAVEVETTSVVDATAGIILSYLVCTKRSVRYLLPCQIVLLLLPIIIITYVDFILSCSSYFVQLYLCYFHQF